MGGLSGKVIGMKPGSEFKFPGDIVGSAILGEGAVNQNGNGTTGCGAGRLKGPGKD